MILGQIQGATVDVDIWAPLHEVESDALTQLRNIASLPWVRHVKAMPDVHLGKGATVGSVIAMKDAVSPNAVGVDIGCGMAAARTSLRAEDLPDDLKELRSMVEAVVPVGNGPGGSHDSSMKGKTLAGFEDRIKKLHMPLSDEAYTALVRQMGTLGGGNHFIELCIDDEGFVWMMLHSGSRNIGKRLAEYHIKIAKQLDHNKRLPDPDLAAFLSKTPEMEAYRSDLYFAQDYAKANRNVMLTSYAIQLTRFFEKRRKTFRFSLPVQCHHNYVAEEHHHGEDLFVTRKGAIRAGAGEMGIIPGSMGTRSYIVRGRGSSDSLCSASHGAGRRMSRGEARRRFTLADFEAQTKGVECRKDTGVIDEIPGAYKSIDQVMENQNDLVEVVHALKQVMCIKG